MPWPPPSPPRAERGGLRPRPSTRGEVVRPLRLRPRGGRQPRARSPDGRLLGPDAGRRPRRMRGRGGTRTANRRDAPPRRRGRRGRGRRHRRASLARSVAHRSLRRGRCEACQGDGLIKIEMHFLPDIYVTCDSCKGRRYNRETLEITWRDKSIADVLDMTVEEGVDYFKAVPSIREKLETMLRVGLGYVRIGQQATTLSGGEAQRVKLSKELSRRATGRTIYILDEPTTGLHFHDIAKLLEVLQELVEQGNSVIVIEHNMDVIKTADWIIDLGPEGGDGGGYIVAEGTPEQVAKVADSHTGPYLTRVLKK